MKKKVSPTQKALNLWAVILIVWSVYRVNLRMPEWFDELVAKPLVFIVPVYYYLKTVDKKNFFPALFLKPRMILKDLLFGLMIGAVFIASALLANYFRFKKLIFFSQPPALNYVLWVSLLALATGISEEILSRGFILKKLYEDSHNIYTASFFASILFFFLHVPILFTNIHITGNLLLIFMLTDMILSLVLSFIFLTRQSLTLPIIIHALYNIVLTLFV
ncbi:hypothetical protein COS31_05210 [Candidatus Roizmanbacteria bacterium CG02_land_8_20_14_3_00_36_15]|uniref:CAAX prenyl protease 2/Lysostaphin resistance protein A-like domain-containing protein n=1 Tax=Candidatus Roizmanbacteria bacterium CG_4_8_14_3_um_filter_36_10 TaxID=1974834 RepID=A0A2M8GLS2_9BACT|nr:MAG: hypothetical protein COS51_02410 [Candidatus Roizmanbacteria bacterium CG03_land_8_20_14_0_80_36_21]PIV37330.1 MAG: hypothetical protein COS31_05210 [Candidatus Roizmanbacteria bacterium CG02_land_8_20_14_3_00_36_15]PIY69772.1 MAG: hypothetical protein COY89_04630 [Candidatus Roizmanbacteria bacterium CG_4_10_14_0_8_um_filter_36_36]PJA53159.1 MAG: hypothetical protein CO166_02810 [Candidatus Roizmanbacteria bacterium CG_4_9_14_3_um_filter_36_11]PJC81503.1 MAG: hypothetical protein CO007